MYHRKKSKELLLIGRCIVFCAFLLCFITACVKTEETRGYVTEFSDFNSVEPGKTTKEEVIKALGSPSSTSSFGDETWYYIGMKMEKTAFLDPEIVKQNIFLVTFDDKGIVKEIGKKSEKDRRDIDISKETTPTEGNKVGVVEQFLGNLGRFNPKE